MNKLAPEGPRSGGLRRTALSAVAVWVAAYFPLQFIRLGGQVVLAQLLNTYAFGVVRLGTTVIQGLRMLSEVGIGHAIIRSPRGEDRAFLDTAWTLQVIRSSVLWLLATGLAYPMSLFFDDSNLALILPALAVATLIGGFESTKIIECNRQLRERPRAVLEITRQLLSRITMILFAVFVSASAWSLVAGTIVAALVTVVQTHALPGPSNRFRWDRDAVREIWTFGRWIFVGTMIAYFGQQLDTLVLGKVGNWDGREAIAVLGVYGVALGIARLPAEISGMVTGHVYYPLVSEVSRSSPESLQLRVSQSRSIVLPGCGLAVLGVVAYSPWFFATLYPDEFGDASWIAPLACFHVWVGVLNDTTNRTLLALGETKALARSGALKVIMTGTACLAGAQIAQLPGFVVGVAVGTLAEHLMDTMRLRSAGGLSLWKQDLYATLPVLGGSLACVAVVHALPWELSSAPFVAGIAIPSLMVLPYALWVLRTTQRRLRDSKMPLSNEAELD